MDYFDVYVWSRNLAVRVTALHVRHKSKKIVTGRLTESYTSAAKKDNVTRLQRQVALNVLPPL